MKKGYSSIVLALVAVLIIALAFTACDTLTNSDDDDSSGGTTGGPSPTDPTSLEYRPAVFSYTDGSTTSRATYTYDDDGKLTQIFFERQASAGADWIAVWRQTFTYDASDALESNLFYSNDSGTSTPTWTLKNTTNLTFDADGRLTEYFMDNPDSSEEDSRFRAEYTNGKPSFLYLDARDTEASEWSYDGAGRIAVTYSADGSTMNWAYQNNNGTYADPVWETNPSMRDTYTNDADGRLSTIKYEIIEDGETTWVTTYEQTTTYNDDGWILTSTDVNGDDSGCTPDSPCTLVTTFSFDAETGLPTTVTNEGYSGTITWEDGTMNDAFVQSDAGSIFDGWEAHWLLWALTTNYLD